MPLLPGDVSMLPAALHLPDESAAIGKHQQLTSSPKTSLIRLTWTAFNEKTLTWAICHK